MSAGGQSNQDLSSSSSGSSSEREPLESWPSQLASRLARADAPDPSGNSVRVARLRVPRKSVLGTPARISVPPSSGAWGTSGSRGRVGLEMTLRECRPRRGPGEAGADRYAVAGIQRSEGNTITHEANVFGFGLLELNDHSHLDRVFREVHRHNLLDYVNGGLHVLQKADELVKLIMRKEAMESTAPYNRETRREMRDILNQIDRLDDDLQLYAATAQQLARLQQPRNWNRPELAASDGEIASVGTDGSEEKPKAS